jgi:hypothetical protein
MSQARQPEMPPFIRSRIRHRAVALAVSAFLIVFSSWSLFAAESAPQVTLSVSKAASREVEALTQRSIVRDYKFAWANLDLALQSNSTAPLNGLLVGPAAAWLNDAVTSQRRNGISSRYSNQVHKLDAVFYAPEGDVIELHDTAEYDLEVLDGSKTIHTEHAVVHYVVLMTPAADRWVVRQLQSVPQF